MRPLLLLPVLLAGFPSAGLPRAQAVVLSPLDRASTLPGVASTNNFHDRNDRLDNDAVSSNANPWFDAHGNTRTNGTDRFLYDWANRLTNAVLDGATVSLAYDADGNRLRKTVQPPSGPAQTTLYLVSAMNPSGYAQVMEERTVLGNYTNLARRYTYGLDLLSQWQGGTLLYFAVDGLGSTRLLTDAGASVVNAFAYDAWGTLIASNGAPQTDYLFAGEQWDPHLRLYYNRARLLDPGLGRFLTRDTWEGAPSDPLSLHNYLYAHGNPVNMIDPSGHESLASVNFSMAIVSQMVMHELRGANGALKGARAMFGSDDSLDSLIYGLDVIGIVDEKVGQVALGAAGVYGGIKVAGWIKNTFGSTRIAQEVLASLKKLAAKFPGKPKPSGELGQYIYRTITPGDPHYQQFKNLGDKGQIAPKGGHNDLTLHVQENNTDSIFTSWSKNQDANWSQWSTPPGSIQLRIKVSELENPAIDVSQWSHFPWEEEVTVIGTILNVERVR